MDDFQTQTKDLWDKLMAFQTSFGKLQPSGVYTGLATSVPPERALKLAKEWTAKMEEDASRKDQALAEFDMKCALYWLRFAMGKYSLEG